MSDIKTIWNNNAKRPASYETEYNNTSAKIVRLVEDPAIKKRIEFDEVSLPEVEHVPNLSGHEGTYSVHTVLGSAYPIIRINDALIARDDIKYFSIESSGFIPTVKLSLDLKTTEFVNRHMPKDGDIISTYVTLNTKALNYLRNDFIITSCQSNVKNSQKNKVDLTGKLFIPKIDSIQTALGFIGTSKEVFKEVAKMYGLGFAYNDEEDTDDMMDWICCKQSIPTFLQDVISHSWKNGLNFYKTWIDFYYNICFVNVNKFLLSTESTEDTLDYTFLTNTRYFYEAMTDPAATNTQKFVKIFSNDSAFQNSPFFIDKWTPINNSSSVSMKYGYESDSYVFIHNQKIIESDPEVCFNVSYNMPNYDETKLDDHIIFRGRGKWQEGMQPEDDLRRVNHDYIHTYVDSTWCGVEYTMGEEDKKTKDNTQWSGNVHPNYGHAPFHNMINQKELDKMYIEIECPGLCLQVMRGEKVPVYLIYASVLDTTINNDPKNDDIVSKTNKFYSGWYIVDSIEYSYKIKGDSTEGYRTKLVLKRREWPTPEPVIKDEQLYNEEDADA